MFRHLFLSLISVFSLSANAQNTPVEGMGSDVIHRTHKLRRWNIPAGNYSGITPLGDNRYAIVTDKPHANGFYVFEININSKGKITDIHNLGFRSDSLHSTPRDMEGIAYVPNTGTVFISAENDQEILEYTLDGKLTGRKLCIPEAFSSKNIQDNYGFEALAYSDATHLFWTTTENTLKSDLKCFPTGSNECAFLRIQSFSADLQPALQFAYMTDAPLRPSSPHRYYCFGVPEITALPDGSLLFLEREFHVANHFVGSFVVNKIYHTVPSPSQAISLSDSFGNIPPNKYLKKKLITKFRTSLPKIANHEGMCLGPVLPDGTQTLLLISDAQDNYGNMFYHLRDRIRIVLLR